MDTKNETVGIIAKKELNVIIVSDLTPDEELRRVSEILINLRRHTKYWEEHFGSGPKDRKNTWQKIADKWIDEHVKFEG